VEYFILLGLATVAIAGLAAAIYRRCGDMGVIVGIGALYYWSLYGAWFVVIDKLGGASGKSYYYLERKLFPVSLDEDYLLALALYAGFIITVELTILALAATKTNRVGPKLTLRHEPILLLGFLAGIASFLLIREKLGTAWALNTSAYWYTRSQTDEWFTVHQVLNRVALIPPAIGVATIAAGNRSRFFVSATRRFTVWGYALLFCGMGAFTFVLGNKNEVFTAMLAGFLAYLASVRRPNWTKVLLTGAAGLWFLYAIDYFRATPLNSMSDTVTSRIEDATGIGRFVTSSNEAFAAHFSLYGVLHAQVAPQFGYSIYSLACSIIPRIIWKSRPPDIYVYYSESVGAVQNQGYSLHHAAGWYLNFGIAGIFLGAIVLGLFWVAFLNAHRRIHTRTGLIVRIFAVVAPWVFAAGLPPLIRAGPEGYKGIFIESIVIPVGVLLFACRPKKARTARVVWTPEAGWVWQVAR
jgi:hypothetical protein